MSDDGAATRVWNRANVVNWLLNFAAVAGLGELARGCVASRLVLKVASALKKVLAMVLRQRAAEEVHTHHVLRA
jgi:hypothetical protein